MFMNTLNTGNKRFVNVIVYIAKTANGCFRNKRTPVIGYTQELTRHVQTMMS